MASSNITKPITAKIQHDIYTKILQGQSLTNILSTVINEELKNYAVVPPMDPAEHFESSFEQLNVVHTVQSPVRGTTPPISMDENVFLRQELDELKNCFHEEHNRSVEQQDFIDQLLTENQTQAHNLKRFSTQKQQNMSPSILNKNCRKAKISTPSILNKNYRKAKSARLRLLFG